MRKRVQEIVARIRSGRPPQPETYSNRSGPGLALAIHEREWHEHLETRIEKAKAIIAETEMDSKISFLRERAVELRESGSDSRG